MKVFESTCAHQLNFALSVWLTLTKYYFGSIKKKKERKETYSIDLKYVPITTLHH